MFKDLNINIYYCLSIVIFFILLGCESSENKSDNVPPMVSAGVDAVYNEKERVFLFGEASDSDGTIVSTTWLQLEGPNIPLINDSSINAEFVAPIVQETKILVFELSVTDNLGAKSSSVVSITTNPVNKPPLVSLGSDFEVNEGEAITLPGEVSDPDGEILSTSWKQLEGISVELDDASSVNTTFIAPVLSLGEVQILTFELTVTDSLNAISTDSISITVNPVNKPPLVSAGLDFEEYEGSTVTLQGEVSDTDGEILSTSWKQLRGISVELTDAFSVNSTFITPALALEEKAQILVFELTVTDNSGAITTDSISITINSTNGLPIAKAGEDQILAPTSKVTLDCSQSYDPEGSDLKIIWVQISGSSITLDDNFSCLTTFKLPNTAEVFEFALTVENTKEKSSTDFVSITSTPTKLPLLTIDNFEYQGGFRSPDTTGAITHYDTLSYSPGVIAYNPVNHSIFVPTHAGTQAIVEFAIPEIVNSRETADFKISEVIIQNSGVFHQSDRVDTGINDRFLITGLALMEGKLVVNYMDWYDTTDEKDTTVIFQDADNLASGEVTGPLQINGAMHAAGWITPIPKLSQDRLGGLYLSGFSSGAILSRLSVGPSAFIYKDAASILNAESGTTIENVGLLDFPYPGGELYNKSLYGENPISIDDILYNNDLKNDLWTRTSSATHGFIVPDSNTYVTLGHSSGHEFGLAYKALQDDGTQCGGPCSYVASDKYNYYWLWNINDLVKVKQGLLQPHDLRPYEYGKLNTPSNAELKGASYDANSGLLYVSLKNADTTTKYARPPLIYVYKISINGNP